MSAVSGNDFMDADSASEPRRIFAGRQLYDGTSPGSDDEDSGNMFGRSATSTSSRPTEAQELAVLPEPEQADAIVSEAEEVSVPQRMQANVIDHEQQLELRRRQDIRNCALCWEELPYVAGARAGQSNDRSAMLQKIQDFRKIIFRFEQMLSGRQNDETIFTGMLQLRSLFVEQYLDEHGYRYRKWTIRMLRDHYNPSLGHKLDIVREINNEIDNLRRINRWSMKVRTRAHCDALARIGSLRSPPLLTFIVCFV